MSEGIGEILTYAVGVAIVPVAIIAVILMLFSSRARVNGPVFVAGWVVALGVASAVAYLLADAADVGTDETASDTVSWGKLAVGVLFLLLAAKQWRGRPAPAQISRSIERMRIARASISRRLVNVSGSNCDSLSSSSWISARRAERGLERSCRSLPSRSVSDISARFDGDAE